MSSEQLRMEELEFYHLVRDLTDDECSELYELRYHPTEPWCGPELNAAPVHHAYPDEWPADEADLPF